MDVEWAKDGQTQEIFIVQARPETVVSQKPRHIIEEYSLSEKGIVVVSGKAAGTSLPAQARYASGVREILECFFEGRPIREEYLIVNNGKLAGIGAHSYSAGDTTKGSEEAARFR
jgi:hypothetical protein